MLGLPQWLSGEEFACPRGLIPDPGRSHMPQNNWPMRHNHWAWALEPGSQGTCSLFPQGRPLQWEAHAPQLESSPRSPQLKKSPSSNDDLAQSKAINFFKKLSKSYYRASLILIRKYQNK